VYNTLDNYSDSTIKDCRLDSGSEVYAEGAYIQNLVFTVKSI